MNESTNSDCCTRAHSRQIIFMSITAQGFSDATFIQSISPVPPIVRSSHARAHFRLRLHDPPCLGLPALKNRTDFFTCQPDRSLTHASHQTRPPIQSPNPKHAWPPKRAGPESAPSPAPRRAKEAATRARKQTPSHQATSYTAPNTSERPQSGNSTETVPKQFLSQTVTASAARQILPQISHDMTQRKEPLRNARTALPAAIHTHPITLHVKLAP